MPDPATVGQILGLVKLAQYTASGIGADPVRALFPSWVAKREAKAKLVEAKNTSRVMEIDAAAQSRAVKTLAEGYAEAQTTLEPSGLRVSAEVDFSDRVEQSVRFQATKKQANMESVVEKSAEELGDHEVPDEEPDHDWTARFFEYAQDISSDDMQTLWAKVLAGEVERPGATSLRTLSVLRNLDAATAHLFAQLCSRSFFVVVGRETLIDGRVSSLGGNAGANSLRDYGMGYPALTILQEHGLLTPDLNSWLDYSKLLVLPQETPPPPDILCIRYGNVEWYVRSTERSASSRDLRMYGVAMSQAGLEISRVVHVTPDEAFSKALAASLQSQNLELVRFRDGVVLGAETHNSR